MNRILLLVVAAIALVGLSRFRHQQRAQLERLRAAEAAMQEVAARADYAESRNDLLGQEVVKLQTATLTTEAKRQQAGSAPAAAEHAAAKLFRDPEMRTLMKKDLNAAMERNVSRLINTNLIRELRLTPEQAARLKDLVRRKHTSHTELLMAMMSGTATDAELAQLGRVAREQADTANAEARALLGEEGFAAYKWQEETAGERARLSEFRAKFAETGFPFSPEQEEALLHAMYDERSRFPFTHDFHNPENFDANRLAEIYSEENLNRWIDEMNLLNDRIIARAQAILPTEQAVQFAQLQRDHFEKSKMTVKMTMTLFPVRKPQ